MKVEAVLDEHFPKEVRVRGEVTMKQLEGMRDALRVFLPDAQIELSLFMNTICLTVFVRGSGKYTRSCTVISDAHDLTETKA